MEGCGAACCLGAASSAAAVAAPAALLALVRAPTLGADAVGTPVVAPCTWILAAFSTCKAAMFRLPEPRMPASPASTVPTGAIRLRLPGGTPGIGARVAMPAPLEGTGGERKTLP